jgi:hypothetical protein
MEFLFWAVALFCPPLPEIPNGKYTPVGCTINKQVYGTKCNISCAAGFQLKGPKSRVCGGVGKWSGRDINTCLGELQCYVSALLIINEFAATVVLLCGLETTGGSQCK